MKLADLGHGTIRANKVMQLMRKKCLYCGKGFTLFEIKGKYHKACYKLVLKERKKLQFGP